MAQGFKRHSTVTIEKVYNRPADIARLAMDWQSVVKRGGTFCPDGACPFVPGEKFDYNLNDFLYYRARAITADIANQNGDRFPHPELKTAWPTFVGKGVYFNHDSDKPEKAFGIILDAAYTPVLFDNDAYDDKYIELLCAIDRKAVNQLRPGLLGDIESGKVTSTSMGTIAQRAQCSVCGNMATNMDQLCLHVHPQSPLYCKGRDVYGKKCYEDNFGLTFIEDSIVYIPADATARMLEVYATVNTHSVNRMAELFEKYAIASGKPVARPSIELSQNFIATGGFMPQAAPKQQPPAIPGQPQPSPYQAAVGEVTQQVGDSTEKLIDTKIRRIIEEELRKTFAPLLEGMDKAVRPEIKTRVEQEFEKVKGDVGTIAPEVAQAPKGPAAKAEEGAAAPAPEMDVKDEAPKEAALQYPISFVENFASWSPADRERIVNAVNNGRSFEFKGMLEFPVKDN